MAQFVVFAKGIEVNGKTILSIMKGMGAFKSQALGFLKEAGLDHVEDDDRHWYDQEKFLNAFKRISEELGDLSLMSIGRAIPDSATFPPVKSIVEALQAIDVAYHMNHRNSKGELLFDPLRGGSRVMLEGIGHYSFSTTDQNSGVMVCQNPYPCKFDEGIIRKMAEICRSKQMISTFQVVHDDSNACRKNKGASCTYRVSWK